MAIVTFAIFLTLAARPFGAFVFGLAADCFGRRPVLIIDILAYSFLEFASGLAPSLSVLLFLRALFGVATGGEWGVGASLTMETIPPQTRGVVSGILQTGYLSGYLLASIAYFALYDLIGWRGMFMVGALPALLVVYNRGKVEESPAFLARANAKLDASFVKMLRDNVGRFLYVVLLMTAFNFLSHGSPVSASKHAASALSAARKIQGTVRGGHDRQANYGAAIAGAVRGLRHARRERDTWYGPCGGRDLMACGGSCSFVALVFEI